MAAQVLFKRASMDIAEDYGRDGRRVMPRLGPGGPGAGMGPHPGAMGPPLPAIPPQIFPEIDREKTCPLLMRVFPKLGGHHRLDEFTRAKQPADEIQIYTWMDATLRELSDLIKEVNASARGRNSRLSFAFVYPDRKGRNIMRQVGSVHSTRVGEDDEKSLRQLNFQTGDYVDVGIYA